MNERTRQDDGQNARAWLHADGRVAIDLPCLHCRYNLRTLHVDGICPECGTAVAESTPLSAASAAWLVRLRLGAVVLLLSLVAAATVPPAYEYALFLTFGPESSRWPQDVGETVRLSRPNPWTGLVGLLIAQIPRAVALMAILLITANESAAARRHDPRSRRMARGLAWVALLWLVGATAVGAAGKVPRWVTTALMPGSLPQDTLHIAIAVAALGYTIHLSRRVASRKLAAYAGALRWLCIPLGLGWLAMDAMGTVVVLTGPSVVEAPYAIPVQVGPTTTSASGGAGALEYIVVHNTLAMTRTTTAPAYMVERWERYEVALKQSEPKLSSAVNRYTAIRGYVMVPSAVWGLGALLFVALLCQTLHKIVREHRASIMAADSHT